MTSASRFVRQEWVHWGARDVLRQHHGASARVHAIRKAGPPMADSASIEEDKTVLKTRMGPSSKRSHDKCCSSRTEFISPLHDNDTRIMQTRPIKCAPDNSLFIRGWRSGGDETAEENKWARGSFCYWWCYSTSDFYSSWECCAQCIKKR